MTASEFCESLAEQSPLIHDILAEHISYHEELLPHVFLADVTRYVLAEGQDRRRVVQYIEDAFGATGPEVKELIAVSFIEHLENRDELERATNSVESPQIRGEWERQRTT